MSPTVVAEATRRLEGLKPSPDLHAAPADRLPFADKSFDITLSSVMLVCVGPETIEQSLSELLRVTRGFLVLAEPWSDAASDRADRHPDTTYWIRHYRARLSGRAELVHVQHLPREHHIGHLNAISVFRVM